VKALLVGAAAGCEAVVARALGVDGRDLRKESTGAVGIDLFRDSSPALVVVQDPQGMSSLEFCRRARACPEGRDAVILVLSSREEELEAVLDAGATDVHPTSLGPAALEIRLHIAKHLVAERAHRRDHDPLTGVADSVRKREVEALQESEAMYRMLFAQSPIAKFLYDAETLHFLAVNDAAIRSYGYSREEFLRMTLEEIRPKEDVPALLASLAANGAGTTSPRAWRHKKKSGKIIDVEITVHKFDLGRRPCGLAIAQDVTERNRLEAQVRQAQKMEAIGSLAGGIAHDFNNLLTVILSYGDVVAAGLPPGDPFKSDVEEIVAAGKRAADLTRQLLMFSRQEILQPKVLDLNAIVGALAKMLRRVVGEDVELCVVSGPGLGPVTADPGQIEQVLLNLVVNARDAMSKGGKLTIETANVELDASQASTLFGARAGGVAGRYVMLAVTDTGSGMSASVRERIFEPFFTTKARGKGTGLGLSTVFGIVQQSGGSLHVESELGVGTTFKVYLPEKGPAREVAIVATEARTKPCTETVLVVEDEGAVRTVVCRILGRRGYTILEAESGPAALILCEQHQGKIDVLLTDVVMPKMSGRELAERLRPQRPEMKVLYMSGYTDDTILRHGVLHADVAFLQKPITYETLTRKLREVIDSPFESPRGVDGEATSGIFAVVESARLRKVGSPDR